MHGEQKQVPWAEDDEGEDCQAVWLQIFLKEQKDTII